MKNCIFIQVLADDSFVGLVQRAVQSRPEYRLLETAVFPPAAPDIALIDLPQFAQPQQEQLQRIHEQYPRMLLIGRIYPPITISLQQVVSAHISGFIPVHSTKEEIIKAIQTVWQGYPYLPTAMTQHFFRELQLANALAKKHDEPPMEVENERQK